MNDNAKALASILISFIVATLTISVAPNIDSKKATKAVITEKNSGAFHWGEGEIWGRNRFSDIENLITYFSL